MLSQCCVGRSVAMKRAAAEPPFFSLDKGQGNVRSLETRGASDCLWSSCLDGCVLCCTQRPLQVYIKVLPRLNQCIFSFFPSKCLFIIQAVTCVSWHGLLAGGGLAELNTQLWWSLCGCLKDGLKQNLLCEYLRVNMCQPCGWKVSLLL